MFFDILYSHGKTADEAATALIRNVEKRTNVYSRIVTYVGRNANGGAIEYRCTDMGNGKFKFVRDSL